MEKILNQEEIDALFLKAQGQGQGMSAASQGAEAPAQHVTVRDIRQAGQLGKEHVRAVSMLHDSFARNLTYNLGAYLRGVFEVNLVSVEQLSYAEFLQRIQI